MPSLSAQPLRYLIARDSDPGVAGMVTVIGYGADSLPISGAGYVNCRVEEGGRRDGVLYLPEDDIERQYGEPAIIFTTLSFWENFDPQVAKWKRLGAPAVEIDNLDTYDVAAALKMFDQVAKAGMGVLVKNPNLVEGDKPALIRHPSAGWMIVEYDDPDDEENTDPVTAGKLDNLRRAGGKADLPVTVVSYGSQKPWAQQIAQQARALGLTNFGVTYSPDDEYGSVEHILLPTASTPNTSDDMAYSLTWLPDVLRAAGLKVIETDGWKTRGHGDMGKVQGVLCHHTNGAATGNMPTLPVLIDGRSDLAGPLSQLGLGRDGTYYVVCAGKGWHAGSGGWKGITDGNSHLIGIEAENVGTGSDPWPAVQMDAYRRGVAAILQHVGATADYAIGHKEWTPRKDDPTFDMGQFRRDVATLMAGGSIQPLPDTPESRPVLGKGDSGSWVEKLQKLVGVKVDGDFGPDTDAAVRTYQATRGLRVDGLVGPETWGALMSNAPAVQPAPTASGKASWYGQYDGKYRWRDDADDPSSNALGVPDDAQGISFPQANGTLGQWFAITGPEGITTIEQQTEHGPAAWTGKLIDIHAACAERHGYSPHNIPNSPNPFPTPSIWSWRKIQAPAAVAGLSPRQQAVKWRDLRKTNPQPDPAPTPQPEPQPMPDAAVAQIMSALTNIDARLTRLEQAPVPAPAGGPDWVRIISSVGSTMKELPHAVEAVDGVLERVPQIVAAAERIANLAERFGPLIGLLGGKALSAAPPVLIQAPAATQQPPASPAASSGPGVGFWPGLLTVIGSAIAALNGIDPHIAASVAAPGVGLMGAAAVKATPKDWTAVRASIAPKT